MIRASGQAAADLDGGAKPLVGVARRHPDVEHPDVGAVLQRRRDVRRTVADSGHDLVAGLGEQQLEPLPQEERVVRDDDSHCPPTGSHAATTVGPPAGELTSSRPSAASDPLLEPGQAAALGGMRASDAVVLDADLDAAVLHPDADRSTGGLAVLGDVGQCLGDHEVDRGLDVRRQRVRHLDGRLDGHLAAHGQLTERRGEAAVDQQRRGDAARERAQLVDGLARLQRARRRWSRRPGRGPPPADDVRGPGPCSAAPAAAAARRGCRARAGAASSPRPPGRRRGRPRPGVPPAGARRGC